MAQAGSDWLCAGEIVGAYGVKGWVRVRSYTDPPGNLFALAQWRLRGGLVEKELTFVDWRAHGKGFVARLQGTEDRDAAERLRGMEIWVPESALPLLDDGEYYWRDLMGLRVYCEHAGSECLLGAVGSILETGANDVLVVRPCDGSLDQRERLLPWAPGDVVREVDPAGGCIRVRWHPDD